MVGEVDRPVLRYSSLTLPQLLEILYTLPDEVRSLSQLRHTWMLMHLYHWQIAFVWSTKLSLVNTAYILNKYSTIGDTTLDLVRECGYPSSRCHDPKFQPRSGFRNPRF